MKVVILYGPPAVGKLTVAKALSDLSNYPVLHNHLLLDLTVTLMGRGTPENRALTRAIRLTILENAKQAALPGIILTFVYSSERQAYVLGLCDAVETLGGTPYLVKLYCAETTLAARVTNASREQFEKLTSVTGLEAKLHALKTPFATVQGRPSLAISTDERTPLEAARAIMQAINA